jgi:alkanesulfonate monooxygenase SsuD/methylene tetrahydromethanopterin reductase-like flavin-dependent oxidoreductase (luciferase family)
MVAVSVLCAPEEEEARWLAGPSALAILQLRSGKLAPLPTPEQAEAYEYSPAEAALVAESTASHLIGDPETVGAGLLELQRRTDADEIMLSTRAHSVDARARSLALIAGEWASEPASAAPASHG